MRKKQYHPSPKEICRDFGRNGIGKFHRLGVQKAWREMCILFDYVLVKSFHMGADKLNTFHSTVDYYYYKLNGDDKAIDEAIKEANEIANSSIEVVEVTEKGIDSIVKSKYEKTVATINAATNNEILKANAMQEACGILALRDMGWGNKAIERFSKLFVNAWGWAYANTRVKDERLVLMAKYITDLRDFEYEEIIDV